MTTIAEWFEPYNCEHLRAFQHLDDVGEWPKDFLPSEIEWPRHWHYSLCEKIAKCWIHHCLDREGVSI